jgi:protein-tyrosine-phosphatase/predicted ATP-grasp superfamily ATP-dependent carboligase
MTTAALVLDGHSRAALETLQSLGRRGIAVDLSAERDCLGWRSRYCHRPLRQPQDGDWVEGLFTKDRHALLVPSTEVSLRAVLRLPEAHAARRAAVLAPTRSLEIALSKQLTWELARALNLPVPRSRLIASPAEAAEPATLPCVLKPVTSLARSGHGLVGLAPRIVRSHDAWQRALDQMLGLCPVQEQEYVPGRGVGIECLYRAGERLWSFQHERLHELPLTGGGSSYRRSAALDGELLAYAGALLDRLQWHGVAMVEFRGSRERGYRLMEINPRLWGSLALPIDAGVDFPLGLWRLANGEHPGPQPRYRVPYYTRNLEMDLEWMKENLRAPRADPLLLTAPRLRSLLEYGRVLLGKESWDHFDWRDWRVSGAVLGRTLAGAWRTVRSVSARKAAPLILARRHRGTLARVRNAAGGHVRRVLFVCYGNICRSPLAEVHARRLAPALEAASAGFHDTGGRVAPEWYRRIAAELGVDLTGCRSQRIDAPLVAWAQLIVLSDAENYARFEREFPEALGKATMLGLFLPEPRVAIEDPYMLAPEAARAVARQVMAAAEGLVARLGASPQAR